MDEIEGDLIDNIELKEPDHIWDAHPDDRVHLFRARARRLAREKQNAVKNLPAPKNLFPEQNTTTEKQTNRRKAKGSSSGTHGFYEMYDHDLNLK